MRRRINLWGGPGCGKSTIAAWLFSELNTQGYSVAQVPEYIKTRAYLKQPVEGMDQAIIFANQITLEDAPLPGGIQTIITDSPLGMQCYYARRHKFLCWQEILAMTKKFDELYEPVHIVLSRRGIGYQEEGRYETSEEADVVDREMELFMIDECNYEFTKIRTLDRATILDYVLKQL